MFIYSCIQYSNFLYLLLCVQYYNFYIYFYLFIINPAARPPARRPLTQSGRRPPCPSPPGSPRSPAPSACWARPRAPSHSGTGSSGRPRLRGTEGPGRFRDWWFIIYDLSLSTFPIVNLLFIIFTYIYISDSQFIIYYFLSISTFLIANLLFIIFLYLHFWLPIYYLLFVIIYNLLFIIYYLLFFIYLYLHFW